MTVGMRVGTAVGAMTLMVSIGAARPAAAQMRQVITRAELDAGGWTRLSEIAFALRGASRSTVDGITVAPTFGGPSAFGPTPHAPPTVLVDGVPVSATLAGIALLDLLPVALSQLDSIVVDAAPVVAAGRVVSRGVLNLHTQRGIRGPRVQASVASGNEAGDPGPLAFTPQATRNVDNMGPFVQARAAYGTPAWDVDVAVRRWTDNLTDARLVPRYDAAALAGRPELWVRHLAPSLRIGGRAFGARHDLHAASARLRGTFFVPATRADESLATTLSHIDVAGRFDSSATPVSYRASAARLESAAYDGGLPFTIAHERRIVDAGADVALRTGGFAITLGASAAHRTLARAGRSDSSELEGDALLAAARGDQRFALTVGLGLAGVRAAAHVDAAWPLASVLVRMRGAFATRAIGDDGAWIDRALVGLTDDSRDAARDATLALDASRDLGGGLALETGVTARQLNGLRTAEWRAALALPASSLVGGGVHYRVLARLAGDDESRTAFVAIPRHLLDASLFVTAAYDIRVRAAMALASRTRWRSPATGGDEMVPAVTRLDLSLEKWLLARRIRAQIVARNLLNDVERYHPLGADFRLRVFAGVTATF